MPVTTDRLAAETLRFLPRTQLSRLMGVLADAHLPAAALALAIDAFVRLYGVELSEADVPPDGFASFDEFFTRRLVAGARPVASDPDVLASPADGKLAEAGPLAADASFCVKGSRYTVTELVGRDSSETSSFEGGHYFVVYLAPPDYHRVHAPADGSVTMLQHVPGTLFPVNRIGIEHVPQVFARNERVAIVQESVRHGLVATILVGAIGVGRISLSFDDLVTNQRGSGVGRFRAFPRGAVEFRRGDELGMFHLGSTVVVLVQAGVPLARVAELGSRIRAGEPLARRVAS